jgi:hypothetical protein
VFKFYWRTTYRKFSSGFGALAIWESAFVLTSVGRDSKKSETVVRKYLKSCCGVQLGKSSDQPKPAANLVSISSSGIEMQSANKFTSLIPSRPGTTTLLKIHSPKREPGRKPKIEPGLKPRLKPKLKLADKLQPECSVYSNTKVDQHFSARPPDQTCHRLSFSSSVI